MPPVVLRGELYLAMSIPTRIRKHVPNLVPIGRAVWQLPRHLNLWPPKPPPPPIAPWGIVGRLVFSLCPFPDESADVNQSWCQSDQPFGASLDFLMFDPLKPPSAPLVSRRAICLGISIPRWICTCVPNLVQSVQPFDSFNRLLNVWPP